MHTHTLGVPLSPLLEMVLLQQLDLFGPVEEKRQSPIAHKGCTIP